MTDETGAVPCLDLGNARLKGAWVGTEIVPLPDQRLQPGPFVLADSLAAALQDASQLLLVSTNAARLPEVRQALQRVVPRVRLAGEDFPLRLPTRYREPATCGADRVVAALAAHAAVGGRAVVVDAGTAITVDGVADDGTFLGGQILPGLGLCLQALTHHTALPALTLEELQGLVPVLGCATRECLAAGARHGVLAGLTAAVTLVATHVGPGVPLLVTGADAMHLVHLWTDSLPVPVSEVWLAPNLVVQGLARAHQLWG